MSLRVGDWVEVRPKQEIIETLDADGRLDGMPFMPQMLQYCGRRFRVYKCAHKTCDSIHFTGARKMEAAVHLEGLRCNGQSYGGCEAACLLFWKNVWLRPVEGPATMSPGGSGEAGTIVPGEERVMAGTRGPSDPSSGEPVYVCQATQVLAATTPLKRLELWQYVEDYRSGNIPWPRLLCSGLFWFYQTIMDLGIGIGRPLRWLYDVFQKAIGGIPYPYRPGLVAPGARTPEGNLNLQAGEWVRVKSFMEIRRTLDVNGKNRGMLFNQELVPYCGKVFRVARRVTRILDEKTGRMLNFKNDCIILEGVECEARYIPQQLFCPRSTYHYWREVWLDRAEKPDCVTAAGGICPLEHAR